MNCHNKLVKNKHSNLYRSLVSTVLLTNGIFQFVAPVLAAGTTAGQDISNTATATYEDPSGTTINATSNTVTVTVAEVAGINISNDGVLEAPTVAEGGTPGTPIVAGDKVYYNFTIKNVGNDPTKFRIPDKSKVSITGPGTVEKLQYQKPDSTWADFNTAGEDTASVPADGSLKVRVVVTVNSGAKKTDLIEIRLGNTPTNGQDKLRDTANTNDDDVYTVDNLDSSGVTGEYAGVLITAQEASNTQSATVGGSTYAFATVLKTRPADSYDDKGTAKLSDDTLKYDLGLKVESTAPSPSTLIPAALVGTTVKGLTGNRILVSDAIPKDTELAVAPTVFPAGWKPVYSITPVTTNAIAATWSETAPTDLKTVTRIGFVNDPATVTSVAVGAEVKTFTVQVKVKSTFIGTTLTVNNIAQLFGQTDGVPIIDANGDLIPDNFVYDESGDNKPSNFNDDGTPATGVDANGNGLPTVTNGYVPDSATLTATGTDTGNDNSGSGPGGEANSFPLTQAIGSVLNGPNTAPDAIGSTTLNTDPKYQNDDFTNKSSGVLANTKPGDKIDPGEVTFTNTVKNTSTKTNDISLIPTSPTNLADLPADTKITLTFSGTSKVYVWDGTKFVFDLDGNPATKGDQTAIDDTSKYITIPAIATNGTSSYEVKVDLPANTELSTDTLKGYPVPITAFVDDVTPGLGTETAKNTTIDQVYTGFLKMLKESKILKGTGPDVQSGDETFSSNPKKPAPGNIIEYQIKYKNISDAAPSGGSGNVILEASKVKITEDGATGGNNWAQYTTNVPGTAKDSVPAKATVTFFNSAGVAGLDDSTVSKYEDTLNTGEKLAPQEERTFGFQRKVN
ncbi:MAG: hypothetical protein KME60_29985 [Cyanomargarita calcarea GSE-NOS-MK-12-04C]|jgi:hypothetical protein|uniref:DUF7925 domain-containing protein n=1 Tax=Cyanomargarita calcarea GSE-NOS-MK-12-04C TaxID=2839659 RepID=A0A951QVN1_9CYAN|nr:hypothetical protein [Cyanomargarita calcarea GSE-NOS-MK-12-04C]